ncbi:CubicO group peptidase, beta-lactamase class C family [Flavobacterium succinicans]|uniref:CubicO group peptidase, beta-lactamase class C family n=2 Tax=Flavobacterium succinicans TaxID=29536 RepID=A0A1I4UP13_9FLAO|nr:CubicO group peptidase, beta-lactamase class C family [Flavobacterium succinicans]
MRQTIPRYVFLLFLLLSFLQFGCKSMHQTIKNTPSNPAPIYIDSMMENALDKKFFPGAQVIIGNNREIVFEKNYGFTDYSQTSQVNSDVVYDLASMTKVLATTLITMQLVSNHKLSVNDKLGEKVARFKNTPIANLTLFELLTHTSGLPSGFMFYQQLLQTPDHSPFLSKEKSSIYNLPFDTQFVSSSLEYNTAFITHQPKNKSVLIYDNLWLNPEFYEIVFKKIISAPIKTRGNYLYSDLNMILIQQVIEAVTHEKLDILVNRLYTSLELTSIGFTPLRWTTKDKVAPTEVDHLFRKDTIRAHVHDETAAVFGGVSGNAGLFSNAKSVAVICQLLLNKGVYNGKKILKSNVISKFTRSPLLKKGIYRGLGFDKRNSDYFFDINQYGHTGFTGTFFFVNPIKNRFLIVLTNRVHPTRTNRLMYADNFMAKIWRSVNL